MVSVEGLYSAKLPRERGGEKDPFPPLLFPPYFMYGHFPPSPSGPVVSRKYLPIYIGEIIAINFGKSGSWFRRPGLGRLPGNLRSDQCSLY